MTTKTTDLKLELNRLTRMSGSGMEIIGWRDGVFAEALLALLTKMEELEERLLEPDNQLSVAGPTRVLVDDSLETEAPNIVTLSGSLDIPVIETSDTLFRLLSDDDLLSSYENMLAKHTVYGKIAGNIEQEISRRESLRTAVQP